MMKSGRITLIQRWMVALINTFMTAITKAGDH